MAKKSGSLILRNINSIFYSLAITLGIYISIQELHKYHNISNFIIFSLAILLIYCLELFTTFQNKSSKVEINLDFEDEINELSHFFHKLILPILLYFSIVLFGFYNYETQNMTAVLVLVFFTFWVLFINTKAFLLDMNVIEHKTHYVYDIIKFLIFFLITNSLENFFKSSGASLLVLSIGEGLLAFIIIILMIWRINKLHRESAFYSAVAGVFIGIFFAVFNSLFVINPLQLSLGLIFLFYISTAIIHHRLMKTLTLSVLTEYFVVILLVMAITYGIT